MRSIQRRFNLQKQKNPELGDFINLMKAVYQQKYSKQIISKWFPKLVDKDDYSTSEKIYLIRTLHHTSNMSEEGKKRV